MKKYASKPYEGIITDISSRLIPENMLQYSENIFFKDGKVRNKFGTKKIYLGGFTDHIISINYYKKLSSDVTFLVVCTKSDIYEYDKTQRKLVLRTRCYNTGGAADSQTIAASGNTTLNFTGTTFLPAKWEKTGTYKISFDSTDQNLCTRWFTVQQVTSATALIVIGDGTALSWGALTPDKPYCLRLCYDGTETDIWHAAYPWYDTEQDKRLLLTNGVDFMQEWNGTGNFADSSYPNMAKHVGYYGGVGGERIVTTNIVDGSSSNLNTMLAEYSDPAEITWTTYVGQNEFNMSDGVLVGSLPLQDRIVFYKNSSISLGTFNSNDATGIDPFFVSQDLINGIGAVSINTVVSLGTAHLFFSGENFYYFDGINCKPIGEGVIKYITSILNKEHAYKSFSSHIREENLYLTFIPVNGSEWPNLCVVYNYEKNSWMFWRFKDESGDDMEFTCKGKFVNSFNPLWTDLIFTKTGCSANGTSTLTLPDVTSLEVNMKIEGSGIPDGTYIATIVGTTQVTMKDNAGTAVTVTTASGLSLDFGHVPKAGGTIAEYVGRWIDYLADSNITKICLGTRTGDVFEFSQELFRDYDDNVDTVCTITTRDYEFNEGNSFKHLGVTVGIGPLYDYINDRFELPAYFDIRVSLDYERTWSDWQTVEITAPDGDQEYVEKDIRYMMHGKATTVQLRLTNPFIFERFFLAFNVAAQSLKYDF